MTNTRQHISKPIFKFYSTYCIRTRLARWLPGTFAYTALTASAREVLKFLNSGESLLEYFCWYGSITTNVTRIVSVMHNNNFIYRFKDVIIFLVNLCFSTIRRSSRKVEYMIRLCYLPYLYKQLKFLFSVKLDKTL